MDKAISFYDTASESFYHGLVLGLMAMMDNQYKIKSNQIESLVKVGLTFA